MPPSLRCPLGIKFPRNISLPVQRRNLLRYLKISRKYTWLPYLNLTLNRVPNTPASTSFTDTEPAYGQHNLDLTL